MSALPEFVSELVKGIAVSEGFTNYTTEVSSGSSDKDGFIGIIKSITIQGDRLHNDKLKRDTLHLVCKLMPEDKGHRREFNIDTLFEREVLTYNKVLPLITAFQREKGLMDADCFLSYPKCYAAVADTEKDQFVIIMEDLRPKNFVMWPKREATPHSHASLILTELAKMHAVSFALKAQRPDVYDELRQIHDLFTLLFENNGVANMHKLGLATTVAVLEDEEHLKIAKHLQQHTKQYFTDCVKTGVCEPFGVIGHGDCWVNNHMYRYEDGVSHWASYASNNIHFIQHLFLQKPEPAEVCILDWQTSRFQSPVLDLYDVLLTTSDQEFRHLHYDNLVKHYYDVLSESIRKLGSEPAELITFDDLLLLLKKFARYGTFMTLGSFVLVLPDDDIIPSSEQFSKDAEDIEETVFKPFIETTREITHKRINDLFTDLVAWGYLSK